MEMSELLKSYTTITETKSGFLMTHGKCIYLYNNVCCEAVCRRVMLRSDNTDILAEYAENLFVSRSADKLTAYRNSHRLLKLQELIILYEIPFDDDNLYGIFAYEKDKRLMDAHFTDERISELIDSLIIGESNTSATITEQFKELEEAVRSGEISALNKLYINGKKIQDGGIL